MAKNNLSFHFLFGSLFLLIAMMFATENAYSAFSPTSIHCETSFGEKNFDISEDKIAFNNNDEEQSRKISSVHGIKKARTHKTLNGFTKVLFKDGNKHKIHIENIAKFSDADDYMTVVSPQGHKMTYPISCSKI